MPPLIDLTGQRFGRLVVISRAEDDNQKKPQWNCICDCENKTVVRGNSLTIGHIKSCGCLQRESASQANRTHGMTKSSEYQSWLAMKARCSNPKLKVFKNYGGRGISVCKRWWNSFENFYSDMGECPDGLTLERTDNDKGYSPDNCEWADRKTQNRNSRNARMIKYQGKTQCLSAWGEELKIPIYTLRYRLKNYPPQIAFNM